MNQHHTMNTIVHAAFRRDLTRFDGALAAFPAGRSCDCRPRITRRRALMRRCDRVMSPSLPAGRRDGNAEALEAFWIYQGIDPGDLPVGNGERHHREHSPGGRYHCSRGAVDRRWPDERGEPGVGRGVSRYGLRTTEGHRCLLAQHAAVDPQFHAGIEYRDEGIEVAITRRGKERVHHLALPGEVRVGVG